MKTPLDMQEAIRAGKRVVIGLPNGKDCPIGIYASAWRKLRAIPDNARLEGWSHFTTEAKEIRRKLSEGLHNRINAHIPGYGKGRNGIDSR